jgi:bifunctional NMN adenylyltransferase/nudix hydrolase
MPITQETAQVAVYIGRFQPFHNGHLALLQQALATAPWVVVVIGSAHQARTPKNPFTWQERAEMIRLAVPEADRARIRFLPVRDYYNEARWVTAVREGVASLSAEFGLDAKPRVRLIGHFKDATSAYLQQFSGWALRSVERASAVDAVHIRNAWLGGDDIPMVTRLSALATVAPKSTLDYLRAWSELPFYPALAAEWQMLRSYQQAWACAPYPPVFVTVDAVVQCAGHVLLIRRGQAPGLGLYAVPGGFIESRETAYQSALRELKEETGFSLLASTMQACLKETAVFDHPDRSQRGRTITHAFHFDLGQRSRPEVTAADDAQSATWTPIEALPSMEDQFHDDHFHMLNHFLNLSVAASASGGLNHLPHSPGSTAPGNR